MRKFRVHLLVLLLPCLLALGCKDGTQTGLTKVSMRQEWFPNANFAGELFAMYETDSLYGLDLTLEAGSDQIDPIKLVLSGQNEFGVVSADRLLIANQTGAELVVIGVANERSPTCFLSRKEKQILSPKDFQGHTVGVLTGTNTELVYRILKQRNQITDAQVKEVEAPFDLATFIAGEYDVRPAFVYDEPVSLDLQGISYNLIRPEEFGVNFVGTVYFTTKDIVKEKPQLVQSFVNALIGGWDRASKDQKKAIQYLKQFDGNIDVNRESASLGKAIPYFKSQDGRFLSCSMTRWIEMERDLIGIKALSKSVLDGSIDTSFVHNFYSLHE